MLIDNMLIDNKYLFVLDELPILLCKVDLEGNFEWINKRWELLFGWSREELIGHPFLSFVHPDDISTTLLIWDIFNKVGEENILQMSHMNRYRNKDGSYSWVLWRAIEGNINRFGIAIHFSNLGEELGLALSHILRKGENEKLASTIKDIAYRITNL